MISWNSGKKGTSGENDQTMSKAADMSGWRTENWLLNLAAWSLFVTLTSSFDRKVIEPAQHGFRNKYKDLETESIGNF